MLKINIIGAAFHLLLIFRVVVLTLKIALLPKLFEFLLNYLVYYFSLNVCALFLRLHTLCIVWFWFSRLLQLLILFVLFLLLFPLSTDPNIFFIHFSPYLAFHYTVKLRAHLLYDLWFNALYPLLLIIKRIINVLFQFKLCILLDFS